MKYLITTIVCVMICSVFMAQVALPAYQGVYYAKATNCGTVTDYHGNVYQTVVIGNQCWMQENLKYLPSVVPGTTGSTTVPYYYVHGYNGTDISVAKSTSNYSTYGVLYNWAAAMDACPTGWSLPTDSDFQKLYTVLGMSLSETNNTGYIGTNEGSKISTNATLWHNDAITLNPEFSSSGFNNLPSGYRRYTGTFNDLGGNGDFWTSTELSGNAMIHGATRGLTKAFRSESAKTQGFSVRCIKD